MSKDGTNRGGFRLNAGRKPKALAEKVLEGKAEAPENAVSVTAELVGLDMPPIKDYLTQIQRDGTKLVSDEIYKDTYQWLCSLGIEKEVNTLLIDQYAQSAGRWVDIEKKISETGYLAKHPTTGNAIASPYVLMSQSYFKQMQNAWFAIYSIVRDKSTNIINQTPQDNLMEKLLRERGQ